jgi:hypothetical protein
MAHINVTLETGLAQRLKSICPWQQRGAKRPITASHLGLDCFDGPASR